MSMHADARITVHRRKRFRPDPSCQNLHLTNRDVQILAALDKYRFLDSELISRLSDIGSSQQVRRRLRLLFDHGFVDRPRAQLSQLALGNRPMVYGLSDRGAAYLFDCGLLRNKPARLKDLNRVVKFTHIEHSLGLARCQLAFEAAIHDHRGARCLEPPRKLAWRMGIEVTDKPPSTVRIVPDAYVGWSEPLGQNNTHILIEYDRGTEPITRNHLNASSVLRKMLAYGELHRSGESGFEHFRVAFITTGEARADAMRTAYEAHLKSIAPPGLFLFAPEKDVVRAPLAEVWRDGKDRAVALSAEGDTA